MAHSEKLGAWEFLLELEIQTIDEIKETDTDNETEFIISSEKLKNLSSVCKLKESFIKIKYSEQLRHKLECCCVFTDPAYLVSTVDR